MIMIFNGPFQYFSGSPSIGSIVVYIFAISFEKSCIEQDIINY